jgi:cytochrome c oxidase subunit 2
MGGAVKHTQHGHRRSNSRGAPGAWLAALIVAPAWADELNMPVGVTEISRTVYDLHMLIFWVCVVIGVVVFTAMAITMVLHRKSRGVQPATFHEDTRIEVAWTVVPLLILIALAVPATAALIKMYDTGGEDMTVEVRGYQWKWEYKYLDDDLNGTLSFFSNLATPKDEIENRAAKGEHYLLEVDNPIRIPINRKVRFLITSNDVIHSFWVPDFGIKRDAVPGMLNELWTVVEQPGTYRGQCTELCGKDHGFMPIVVEAMAEDEYDAWYAQEVAAYAEYQQMANETFTEVELMEVGEQVYGKFCASCHQLDGKGVPPVFPALAGGAITTGARDTHVKQVYEGVPGTAMAAFGQQLNAAELAAVVHYERHSWGNDTGDVTQPVDVLEWVAAQQ